MQWSKQQHKLIPRRKNRALCLTNLKKIKVQLVRALLSAILLIHCFLPLRSWAHGFNANTVRMIQTERGTYRIIVRYSHLEVGEFREAIIEYKNIREATKAFEDLKNGADFFLGKKSPNIHFHNEPEQAKKL